ncbi:hypothetical protein STK_13245 [Sulfurisphaera tokodaii str. 7]|uniref:Uncharacterized protein n=1 Tax=Sulfurisphaera tokodaii (strain DSM 16993 / JCM 10545 / NBRC 100140 / 7) TaxID=273063 RepID=Q971N6_SULTO|nr:hypothetical protein [Sulfurisphaera tokodaii]BAB66384.1 hypothetical protein STK_13245 [Sulfurisphaera tokodaii str. 7]
MYYLVEAEDEKVIEKLLKLKARKRLLVEVHDEKVYAALRRHYKNKIRVYKVEKSLNPDVFLTI